MFRPELLLKLENIRAKLDRADNPTLDFVITGGYRIPNYNGSIAHEP